MLSSNDLLLFLSLHHEGEWQKIYEDVKKKTRYTIDEILAAKEKVSSPYITVTDPKYPRKLKGIYQPPFLLYYYGDLSLLERPRTLSCIGTRSPNLYQSDTVYRLIREVEQKTESDTVIVSGMAIGLDSSALRAAMEENAPIIAVIGSGIDKPYPECNRDIYEYCKEGKGLVLSEYPLMSKPKPNHFIFRNRIVTGLSPTLFVGGGKKRSGSATSVRFATDQGKDVMALPCNITGDDLTNTIIQAGAIPVLSSEDLIDNIAMRAEYPS